MSKQRRAGIIFVKVNGQQYDAKGDFSYNLGRPMREGIAGADGVHGFKETPQVPYIEGEITDRGDLDVEALLDITDATITLELANGKVIVLKDGWFAGEGSISTSEGNIAARFEGMEADEVR